MAKQPGWIPVIGKPIYSPELGKPLLKCNGCQAQAEVTFDWHYQYVPINTIGIETGSAIVLSQPMPVDVIINYPISSDTIDDMGRNGVITIPANQLMVPINFTTLAGFNSQVIVQLVSVASPSNVKINSDYSTFTIIPS